jgi:hypothetical protein
MSVQDPFSLPNRLFTKHHAPFLQQTKESMESRDDFDNHQYSDVIGASISDMQLLREPQNSLSLVWRLTQDSKVSPSRIIQMLSSMEDAVISCSRALSKIIDLHNKVDALHISSKRFGEAARNLSFSGRRDVIMQKLSAQEGIFEAIERNFRFVFQSWSQFSPFAIAVSLSPNWIKESFKSHVEPLHIYQVIMNDVAVTAVEVSASHHLPKKGACCEMASGHFLKRIRPRMMSLPAPDRQCTECGAGGGLEWSARNRKLGINKMIKENVA